MPIKVDSLEFMHGFMKRPPVEESHREWSSVNPDGILEVNKPIIFQYNPIGLPFPFDEVAVTFKRCGTHYSAFFLIDSKQPDIFTFEGLGETLEEKRYKFVPLSSGKNALVYSAQGDIAFTIKSANGGLLRLISMGTAGAHTRDLQEDPDIFIKEIGTLEAVANIFLESQLRQFINNPGVADFLKGVLYLNP